MNRREFSKSLLALLPAANVQAAPPSAGVEVNDIHSQLNATEVARVEKVTSLTGLQNAIRSARNEHQAVCIAGAKHAMGGQQFATGATLIETVAMNRVLHFDRTRGLIEVESGMEWPELIDYLLAHQQGDSRQWGIRQKQTGADKLTMGGALSANIHGRGLRMRPFIDDIESFTLLDASGKSQVCSRSQNPELFKLAIGGYGLFGPVYSITLRLSPRQKIERVVEVIPIEELMPKVEKRMADGFLYGDFQYAINPDSEDFLHRGVFSCYRPAATNKPVPEKQKELSDQDWLGLLYLAHANKAQAFQRYSEYYLSTSGQVYWSDTHQMSFYPENYHRGLDVKMGAAAKATEMITEIYVPRSALVSFMREAAQDFRKNQVDVVYGTVRFIERDGESFLQWARQSYACIIFNLHVVHTPEGKEHSAAAFRRLIDMAVSRGGSYYLTYHRYATRQQIEKCYPQLPQFLRLKKKYDPEERFQSEWYRQYRGMFANAL
jgi:FAD/FMN-containing dehydrogenase